MEYLKNLSIKTEKEMNSIQNKITQFQNNIDDLKYQQISKEWYDKDDELEKANNTLNELSDKEEELVRTKSDFEKQLNIYECAELYEDYKDNLKNLRELESKLQNINKTEEEKAPERNNLGYSLKIYYENELKALKEKLNNINKNIENINESIIKSNEISKVLSDEKNNKTGLQGGLTELIKSFEIEEEKFEKRSKIILNKNILGMYEDGFLEHTQNTIQKQIEEYNIKNNHVEKENKNINMVINSTNKEQQTLAGCKQELKDMLCDLEKQKSIYEEELELRKNVIRILSLSNEDIYNKDLLIGNMESKINTLNSKSETLIIEKARLESEKTKLERGIFTEIPSKLKDKLDELDIEFLYGMDWLNKNKKSSKQNKIIVKNNPFLPYSLILSEEDINKIQKSNLNEFTSNPVPIIKKSVIYNEINTINNMCRLDDNISFYISFDNRLVDRNELVKIIEEKGNELNKTNENIALNENDKKDYLEKFHKLKETTVKLNLFNDISNKIENTKTEINITEDKIINNDAVIKQSSIKINENNEKYKFYIDMLSKLNKSMEAFIDLKNNYNKYLNNKEKLSAVTGEINEIKFKLEDNNKISDRNKLTLDNEKEHSSNVKNEIINIENENIEYSQYKEGQIVNRDFEVVKSEYDSLTSKISNDKAFAEEMKIKADEEFRKSQEKLIGKQKEYSLEEVDFNNIKYDLYKHKEIKYKVKYTEELLQKQNDEIHKINIERTRIESSLNNLSSKIQEKFGLDYPKEKELIINVNFNIEIKLILDEKKELEKCYSNKEF